jgi:hypothetical protein
MRDYFKAMESVMQRPGNRLEPEQEIRLMADSVPQTIELIRKEF